MDVAEDHKVGIRLSVGVTPKDGAVPGFGRRAHPFAFVRSNRPSRACATGIGAWRNARRNHRLSRIAFQGRRAPSQWP